MILRRDALTMIEGDQRGKGGKLGVQGAGGQG